jgi:hypothetical protein
MARITNYKSQIGGVNVSSIPTATMVKTAFDAGTSQLTGYIYGGQLNELDTPVNGRADLAAFEVAALAAIAADFAERYEAVLTGLDFIIEVDGLNVVAGAVAATITFSPNEEDRTQFQNFFGLVFDTNLYALANAVGGTTDSDIPAPTTLLAQQGRRPLQF